MTPACPKSRATVSEGWAPTDIQYLQGDHLSGRWTLGRSFSRPGGKQAVVGLLDAINVKGDVLVAILPCRPIGCLLHPLPVCNDRRGPA